MVGNAVTVVMYTMVMKLQKFVQHVIIHRLTSKEELKTTKILSSHALQNAWDFLFLSQKAFLKKTIML